MDVIKVDPAYTSMDGPKAVEVYKLAMIASGLKFEMQAPGMRMSSRISALKAAKQVSGLKTNDRAKQLERIELMLTQAKSEVVYVHTGASAGGDL